MDDGLRVALARIEPAGRDKLRRLLIADHADRDEIAQALLRKRTGAAEALAETIDHLTLDPDLRRRAVRLLGEIEADATRRP
jgi:hypothetical protein